MRIIATSLLLLSLGSYVQAQGGDATALFECPNRGCKLVPASEVVSTQIVDCGHGIAFTVGGFSYAPSDDKCPAWIEYHPSHTVTDNLTPAPNKYTTNGGEYVITKQEYQCTGLGCGTLFLQGCCKAVGDEKPVNTLRNCLELNCAEPPSGGS